ncbi:MAG: bifunctional 5,10-methylenetetrahydrofolate dehydrogenase/5,10-methenyltetrahydrofolate cyclohydrolase [Patescibacteria group bacterium]|nr:bifunctional 5,10-methylenetetrahydrofolate dehydrogenase/5,10-methenyltetrahydrofolate cyclohydrolase [Patescibacteria group bacterium]
MQVFNGIGFAKRQLSELKQRVDRLRAGGVRLKIVSLVFGEDAGSRLYTKFKQQAAGEAGIEFQPVWLSLADSPEKIIKQIQTANRNCQVTGVMIQKPAQKVWQASCQPSTPVPLFSQWWQSLVAVIDPDKDVDGLHPSTLRAIKNKRWQERGRVLPATAQAVLDILNQSPLPVSHLVTQTDLKVVVIGRSEIVGLPIYYELSNRGAQVLLLGRAELAQRIQSGQLLLDADVVISATGMPGLIKGPMLKQGVILIDVGEPKPDVDMASVTTQASFLTPVPGGVGPVTVACLMKNVLTMVQ